MATLQRRPSRGFTLVELLVVITIIGMLVALLLPAVNAARNRANITRCANNMRQIAQALIGYETTKGKLPGYAQYLSRGRDPSNGDKLWVTTEYNSGDERPEYKGLFQIVSTRFEGRRVPVSWATMLLTHIERRDIWDRVVEPLIDTSGSTVTETPLVIRPIEVFLCPSDSDAQANPDNAGLSFVVNTGGWDQDDMGVLLDPYPDTKDNGLFHHVGEGGPVMRLSKIVDGSSTTLMVSENIHRDYELYPFTWLGGSHEQLGSGSPPAWEIEQQVGFGWVASFNPVSCSDATMVDVYSQEAINRGAEEIPEFDPKLTCFTRPASNHATGVNVAFCDGHTQFMNDDIEYVVYQQLLTTNGRKCVDTAVPLADRATEPPSADILDFRRAAPLSEADFE